MYRLKHAFSEVTQSVTFDPYTSYSWTSDRMLSSIPTKSKLITIEEKLKIEDESKRIENSFTFIQNKYLPSVHKRKFEEITTSTTTNSIAPNNPTTTPTISNNFPTIVQESPTVVPPEEKKQKIA